MAHRVTAPLVQVLKADGSYAHVYEGGFLPDDVDGDHLAHLLEMEMVEEADEPQDTEDEPAPRRKKK